jgi:electron transfer flavoprotein alpha/beta subunit
MDYRLKSQTLAEDRVTIWNAAALDADPGYLGLAGSPTVVTGLAEAASRQRKRISLQGSPEEVADQLFTLLQEVL